MFALGSSSHGRPCGTTSLTGGFSSSEESMDESKESVGKTREDCDLEKLGLGHLFQYFETEVPFLRSVRHRDRPFSLF